MYKKYGEHGIITVPVNLQMIMPKIFKKDEVIFSGKK